VLPLHDNVVAGHPIDPEVPLIPEYFYQVLAGEIARNHASTSGLLVLRAVVGTGILAGTTEDRREIATTGAVVRGIDSPLAQFLIGRFAAIVVLDGVNYCVETIECRLSRLCLSRQFKGILVCYSPSVLVFGKRDRSAGAHSDTSALATVVVGAEFLNRCPPMRRSSWCSQSGISTDSELATNISRGECMASSTTETRDKREAECRRV
jgi:hypothetical protein